MTGSGKTSYTPPPKYYKLFTLLKQPSTLQFQLHRATVYCMNRDESIKKYLEGRDEWNSWARTMLEEKERLQESREWEDVTKQNEWKQLSSVNFSGHPFENYADFGNFLFPAYACFNEAIFNEGAAFDEANFIEAADFVKVEFKNGNAYFKNTPFNEPVKFWEATFEEKADFSKAIFSKEAYFGVHVFSKGAKFDDAIFKERADFKRAHFGTSNPNLAEEEEEAGEISFFQTEFKKSADFEGAQFYVTKADFRAMQVERYFSLNKVTFHHCVPDFVQAHFQEAPLLEHLTIPLKRPANTTEGEKKELPARYRALKRLALQGHDHEREQDFFAAELLSLREVEDFPRGKGAERYWGGKFYEWLSDFGRSASLALAWWCFSTVFFANIYLLFSNTKAACAEDVSRGFAPLFLSLKHAFIALPTSVNERTNQLYACLYGKEQSTTLIPIIPDGVAALGITQTLFSAVVIFLFLLAVRAKFRIK